MSGPIALLAGREASDSGSLLRMRRPWDAIVWWEIRRIPFNLLMLAIGLVSLYIFMLAGSHVLGPDADVGSPVLGAIVYGLAANICYTLDG